MREIHIKKESTYSKFPPKKEYVSKAHLSKQESEGALTHLSIGCQCRGTAGRHRLPSTVVQCWTTMSRPTYTTLTAALLCMLLQSHECWALGFGAGATPSTTNPVLTHISSTPRRNSNSLPPTLSCACLSSQASSDAGYPSRKGCSSLAGRPARSRGLALGSRLTRGTGSRTAALL